MFFSIKIGKKIKPDAIPTREFRLEENVFTIVTPTKGEHFVHLKPKATKLSFTETVSNDVNQDFIEEASSFSEKFVILDEIRWQNNKEL